MTKQKQKKTKTKTKTKKNKLWPLLWIISALDPETLCSWVSEVCLPIGWMNDWLKDWLVERLIGLLTDWYGESNYTGTDLPTTKWSFFYDSKKNPFFFHVWIQAEWKEVK